MDRLQDKLPGGDAPDEELIDTLIAVSVVAKRLAEKLRKQREKDLHCPRCEQAGKID